MATRDQFESIADACLVAHEEIKEYGTPEMQSLIRMLMFLVGQELARWQPSNHKVSRDLSQEQSDQKI